VPHRGILSREARYLSLGSRGATVWLTGLSGSGKSSIGAALEQRIVLMARPAYVLDGDNLRHGLCGDLAFTDEGRNESVRRAAHVAQILADAGNIAIVTLISPFAEGRAQARRISEASGVPFFEVHVGTTLEECERRDPKGLYKRARAGEIKGFTGIDHPYEEPPSPDVLITSAQSVPEAVDLIIAALRANGALI
jgi:bifunctional enzyme CysN/CysC